MGRPLVLAAWVLIAASAPPHGGANAAGAQTTCPAFPVDCEGGPCVVDFEISANKASGEQILQNFKDALGRKNTIVRVGARVELDFSDMPADFFPIQLDRCVTLMSLNPAVVEPSGELARPSQAPAASQASKIERPTAAIYGLAGDLTPAGTPGRTPSMLGPILRFGRNHEGDDEPQTFFQVTCSAEENRDGVRITGVRVIGRSFDYQSTDEVGIRIRDCTIEISNNELAGWGGSAIKVESPLTRLVAPSMVKIVGNFLHHNQHPTSDDHAAGYGVNVDSHASAFIAENVFDFNRHAIAADGNCFGYEAWRNLVLKGGGYHNGFLNEWTHLFDVHGNGHSFFPTAWCWIKDVPCFWCDPCEHASTYDRGDAGHDFIFSGNAFQFRNDHAIKIRGRPRRSARIERNVFAHEGFEDDRGDDAVALLTEENVTLGPGNVVDVDTFGKYGVCDFDGDGIDDLFLPTGQTWWFSSFGELHWSYLNERRERLDDLRLGYFDADNRCDVLIESGGEWFVSSGGSGSLTSLGFGAPLKEVHFGRFDPNSRDHRPGGLTRQTTHAFRRMEDGEWRVTPLSNEDWKHAARSRHPMSRLRFGDFTGDAVTDVLAVLEGHWKISRGAHGPWETLNPDLDDDVANLVIANIDADDNIDDVLRLERKTRTFNVNGRRTEETTLTWWRSKNGVEHWTEYKRFEFSFVHAPDWYRSPTFGFAGRFGIVPGGGVMVIDHERVGRFFSHHETSPDWKSVYAY